MGMKVAISIPDPVFVAAERAAKRLKLKRSQLYARAIQEFVRQHPEEDVTLRLNQVYERAASKLDQAWEGASLQVLRRERW